MYDVLDVKKNFVYVLPVSAIIALFEILSTYNTFAILFVRKILELSKTIRKKFLKKKSLNQKTNKKNLKKESKLKSIGDIARKKIENGSSSGDISNESRQIEFEDEVSEKYSNEDSFDSETLSDYSDSEKEDDIESQDRKRNDGTLSKTIKFKNMIADATSKLKKNYKHLKKNNDSFLNLNAHKILFEDFDIDYYYISTDSKCQYKATRIIKIAKLFLSYILSSIQYTLLINFFLTWGAFNIETYESDESFYFRKGQINSKICWIDDESCKTINVTVFNENTILIDTQYMSKTIYCTNEFDIHDVLKNISRIGGLFVVSSIVFKSIDKIVSSFKPLFKVIAKKLKPRPNDIKSNLMKKNFAKFFLSVLLNMIPRLSAFILLIYFFNDYTNVKTSCNPPNDTYRWFESFRFLLELIKVSAYFLTELSILAKSTVKIQRNTDYSDKNIELEMKDTNANGSNFF